MSELFSTNNKLTCGFLLPCRFKNAVFEITSKDIGTFEVTGKFFGVSMEKVELVFQVYHSFICIPVHVL